jgi:ferric-dicitrate binding protein FerR (iron transport regulator)
MSEELFERYLRNELDESGARELSAILATEEGTRAFTEFVQEWTLLGEAARQRVLEAERSGTRKIRKREPAKPGRAGIGWAAGVAAALLFMIAVATPARRPAPPPVAKFEPPPPPVPPEAPKPAPPDPAPAPAPPPPPRVVPVSPPAPPSPVDPPAPAPEPPKPVETPRPEPPRRTEPEKASRPVIALLRRVAGEVQILGADGRRRAGAQDSLAPDEGLELSAQAQATLEFPDATRIEVGPESTVERLTERQGRRSFALSRGSVSATVTRQAAGRAVAVSTPHAEVTVIGTQFLLAVAPDATRLEVREGRVRISREGTSVEVTAGHTAIAGKGLKLESKPTVLTREFLAVQDTSISGADPFRTFGSAETLEVDGDEADGKKIYALVKWDVSELPATAVIRSAVVTLSIVNESKGTGYSFFEMKRAWTEGEATWSHGASQQPWRVAGLKSALDRGTEPLGTVAPRARGPLPILLRPSAEEAIQRWIRRPDTNFGLLIANDAMTDGFKFHSRESATPESRPRLTLTYTVAK